MRAHAGPEDTIYVHASIEEAAKLYFRILRWDPQDVRYGNTGWGCCRRSSEPKPLGTGAQRAYVLRDFERVMAERQFKKVWLVYTGRESHWEDLGRNEPAIIAGYLDSTACRKDTEQHFAYEIVQEFDCAGATFGVIN